MCVTHAQFNSIYQESSNASLDLGLTTALAAASLVTSPLSAEEPGTGRTLVNTTPTDPFAFAENRDDNRSRRDREPSRRPVVERAGSRNTSPRNSEGLLRFAFVVRNEPQCSRPNGAAWIFALRLGIIVREPVTQFLARSATGSASNSDPATGERIHVTACGDDRFGKALRK